MTEKPPNFETSEDKLKSLDEFRAGYPYNFEGWFFGGAQTSNTEQIREIKIKEGTYDPENDPFHKTLERFHRFKTEQPELVQRVRAAVKKFHELGQNRGQLPEEIARAKKEDHVQTELIPSLYEAYKIMRSYGASDKELSVF